MSRLTRDRPAEPVPRDHISRHVRGRGNINFPCSADREQDWQPYPVDPCVLLYVMAIHTYIPLTGHVSIHSHVVGSSRYTGYGSFLCTGIYSNIDKGYR